MIYDEESDRHVHITFEQAMHATGYGHANGPDADIFGVKNFNDEMKKKMTTVRADGTIVPDDAAIGAFTALKDAYDADTVDLTKIRAFVTAVIKAVNDGTWVPLEIVIARPFIEHLMLSAIVAVAGRETGATLFGCAAPCALRLAPRAPRPAFASCADPRWPRARAAPPTCRFPRTPPSRPSRVRALRSRTHRSLALPAERVSCGAQATTRATRSP